MNDIQQFLLDNKGCPSSPAATKQLLVKFIELLGNQEPASGGQLYMHTIKYSNYNLCCEIITTSPNQIEDITSLSSIIVSRQYINLILETGYGPSVTIPMYGGATMTKNTFHCFYFKAATTSLVYVQVDLLNSSTIVDTVTPL